MKKFFSDIENILMLLFFAGILAAIFLPNSRHVSGSSANSRKRSCVSNMKTIEGAIELYNMENGTAPSLIISDLKDKGYLKSEPLCQPAVKTFMGFVVHQQPSGPYKIYISGAISGQTLTDVECQIHGKLSLQDSTDKTKGL